MAERISDGLAIVAQVTQHNKGYFNDTITRQYCKGIAKNASYFTDNKFLEDWYDRENLNFICDEVEETGEPYILVSYGKEEVIAVVTHSEFAVQDDYRWFKFALAVRDRENMRICDTESRLAILDSLFCDRFIYPAMMDSLDIAAEIEADDFMLPIVPSYGIFVPVSVQVNMGTTFTYFYDSTPDSSHEFFTAPAGMVTLSMLKTAWLDWYKSKFEMQSDDIPFQSPPNDWVVESYLSSLDMSKVELNSGASVAVADNSLDMLTVGLTGTSGLGWSLTPTPRDRPDLGWNHH